MCRVRSWPRFFGGAPRPAPDKRCFIPLSSKLHGSRSCRARNLAPRSERFVVGDFRRSVRGATEPFSYRAVPCARCCVPMGCSPFPHSVSTDNGACYTSREFREACREFGIRHKRTRPYRPQTNGKAERFIRTALKGWAYAQTYTHSWKKEQSTCRNGRAITILCVPIRLLAENLQRHV